MSNPTAKSSSILRLDDKVVESKTPVYAPVTIGEEAIEFKLYVNCPTPEDFDKYMQSMENIREDQYYKLYEPVAEIFVDWEGVIDANDEPVPFSKEKLIELQKKYHGFTEGLLYAVTQGLADLRGKNFSNSLTIGLGKRAKRNKAKK